VGRDEKTRGKFLAKISSDFRSLPPAILQPFSHITIIRGIYPYSTNAPFGCCIPGAVLVRSKGLMIMAKTQTLSFPIRLPDSMQAEALRLLDASRIAINQIITDLWPALDLFAAERAARSF
jgi:hypothetical protein